MSAQTETALSRTETIARLNDTARQGRDRQCRMFFTTNLLDKLDDRSFAADVTAQRRIMRAMKDCAFAEDSPERDLAFFEVGEQRVMMKIDYFDTTLEWGSEDPADASITRRMITLMAPEDY